MEGTLIGGRYRIIRELGSGMMGAVFEGLHETLGQRVAVKVLRTEFTVKSLVPRFFREAKAASSLGHPNIVRVFDAGETPEGLPFLVMELLDGENLDDHLHRLGPRPLKDVVGLLRGPASGLDLAHARGILHRDLKLENLFLHRRDDGVEEVRIVDFGLAAFTSTDDAALRLTEPGTYLGTPEYMAPEMIEQYPLDHRADVYALGVMTYELLTGEVPFDGPTPMAILTQKISEDAPPLSLWGSTFPSAVESAVARALKRDRTQRQPTCGALIHELADAAGMSSRHPVPSLSPRHTPAIDTTPPASPSGSPVVLVVEDDPHFAKLVETELTSHGYEVEIATSIHEAAVRLEGRGIHAMVVDGLLPDGSGLELLERVHTAGWKVPTVFVSGFWRDDKVTEMLKHDLDVNLVLHKPLDPALLSEHLRAILPPPPKVASTAPPPTLDPALAAQIETLKETYVEHLIAELEKLYDLIESVASGRSEDIDPLVDAAGIAHQVRGTAGSYGFDELSERIGHVQSSLDPFRTGEGAMLSLRGLRGLLEIVDWARAEARTYVRRSEKHQAQTAFVARLLVDLPESRFEALDATARGVGIELFKPGTSEEELRYDGGLIAASDDRDADIDRVARLRLEVGVADFPIGVLGLTSSTADHLSAVRYGASVVLEESPSSADLLELALRFRSLLGSRRTRLLAIDDDPYLVAQISAWLYPKGVQVIPLHEPSEVLEALEEHQPDLVLLDLMMPKLSGIDVCRVIRSHTRFGTLPIIFLTGQTDRRSRMGCYWAGADDVLEKPVLPEELLSRVELRLRHARLHRERRELDPLTGLRTRQAFVRDAEALLRASRRNSQPLSLALIGLDGMRAINSSFGDAGGDLVLRALGGLLKSRLRAEDLAGRFTGDEVVLALPGLPLRDAKAWVTELRSHFSNTLVRSPDGRALPTHFRAGLAAADGSSLDAIVASASRRADRAKHQGGVCAEGT